MLFVLSLEIFENRYFFLDLAEFGDMCLWVVERLGANSWATAVRLGASP